MLWPGTPACTAFTASSNSLLGTTVAAWSFGYSSFSLSNSRHRPSSPPTAASLASAPHRPDGVVLPKK
jgi:hypothetical protein